MAAMCWVQGRV